MIVISVSIYPECQLVFVKLEIQALQRGTYTENVKSITDHFSLTQKDLLFTHTEKKVTGKLLSVYSLSKWCPF